MKAKVIKDNPIEKTQKQNLIGKNVNTVKIARALKQTAIGKKVRG